MCVSAAAESTCTYVLKNRSNSSSRELGVRSRALSRLRDKKVRSPAENQKLQIQWSHSSAGFLAFIWMLIQTRLLGSATQAPSFALQYASASQRVVIYASSCLSRTPSHGLPTVAEIHCQRFHSAVCVRERERVLNSASTCISSIHNPHRCCTDSHLCLCLFVHRCQCRFLFTSVVKKTRCLKDNSPNMFNFSI